MTYATTFSGIGGWELGLNACGWELMWQCEREPSCRALLTERFGVPIYDDIRTICEHNPTPVDALIGSPPCQPFSVAGAQNGVTDERHLYPAFAELVAQIRPRWVLMEQVAAILSINSGRDFAGYVGGLVALGYSVVWHCIPACAIGAPHERDRLWIIANAGCVPGSLTVSSARHVGKAKIRLQGQWRSNREFPEVGTVRPEVLRRWLDKSRPRGMDDGISDWPHRLRATGNSVAPQIPFLIGQAINQIEEGIT
jgi:DNA (cytosine-5)-methyltransferase 1